MGGCNAKSGVCCLPARILPAAAKARSPTRFSRSVHAADGARDALHTSEDPPWSSKTIRDSAEEISSRRWDWHRRSANQALGLGTLELTGCGGSPSNPARPLRCRGRSPTRFTPLRNSKFCRRCPAVGAAAPSGRCGSLCTLRLQRLDIGGPLQHIVRKDLAPAYTGAPNAARLLYYFSMSDIHIADKESPAQPLYIGWSAPYGPSSSGESSAYSPILLSTPQVLDAAIQTINALHEAYALRFRPVAGRRLQQHAVQRAALVPRHHRRQSHHAQFGRACWEPPASITRALHAAGLNPELPWYQVMGNHDQFWMGSAFEDTKTRNAHVGNTILNMEDSAIPPVADPTRRRLHGCVGWNDALRRPDQSRARGRLPHAADSCGRRQPALAGHGGIHHGQLDDGVLQHHDESGGARLQPGQSRPAAWPATASCRSPISRSSSSCWTIR